MSFNSDRFAIRLIAETLFYDEEYEALGNLSLVDTSARKERYVASYAPEDGGFIVEEATEWEDYEPGSPDDIGYALAVDSKDHATFNDADEAAAELYRLAKQHDLMPNITLLFEEEEV